jgi:hypothetical protein
MRIIVEMEVEIEEDIWMLDKEENANWFKRSIMNKKNMVLHSNEIGEEIGVIKKVSWKFKEKK